MQCFVCPLGICLSGADAKIPQLGPLGIKIHVAIESLDSRGCLNQFDVVLQLIGKLCCLDRFLDGLVHSLHSADREGYRWSADAAGLGIEARIVQMTALARLVFAVWALPPCTASGSGGIVITVTEPAWYRR